MSAKERFPEDEECPVCGESENEQYILVTWDDEGEERLISVVVFSVNVERNSIVAHLFVCCPFSYT